MATTPTGKEPLIQLPEESATYADMSALVQMFNAQRDLQIKAYGKDPSTIVDPEEQVQFIKDMVLAASDELHEFLGEIGWKPWATSRHINTEDAKGELVDLWHFFMNLMLAIGMTPLDLFEGYMEKRGRNIKRQADGYDGVAGKCQSCGRALDDLAKKRGISVSSAWMYSKGRVICLTCVAEEATEQPEEDD